MLPLGAQWDDVGRHRILTEAVFAKGKKIRFLLDEMHHAVFVHETNGDDVITFLQQAFRNVIAARRILIARVANLLTVHISKILIEERAKQQSCRLSGMSLVNLYVLAKPCGADASPTPLILIDGFPIGVVEVGSGEERFLLVEHRVPPSVGKLVRTHLGSYVVVILIESCFLHEHRIVALQRVGRNPCLDGRATPAVHDNALRHIVLLEHFATKEVAYCREQPGILLVHGFPVDGCLADVVLRSMCVGFVLHTEQANAVVGVAVDVFCVPRVDTLDGHIDVRLSAEEPHIAHEHVAEHDGFARLALRTARCHLQLVRSARLLCRQRHLPATISVGRCRIGFLLERHNHRLIGIGLSPHGYGLVALHDHS